jgi:predicted RNA binding protein YcfA (HicA-like mRNA interferase family)
MTSLGARFLNARVTVADHSTDTLPPGTLNSILKQAAMRRRNRP